MMRSNSGKNPRDPKFKAFKEYALDILEKHELRHVFKYKTTFKEFWAKYCKTFDFPLSEIMAASKMPSKVRNYFNRIKSEGIPKVADVKNVDNYLIVSYQDRVRKKKKEKTETKESTEIDTVEKTTDELTDTYYRKKKKIVEINFTSEITTATVARITQACNFKEQLTKDYLYYLNGGTDEYETLEDGTQRKRFVDQLTHLKLAEGIRKEAGKLSQYVLENIDTLTKTDLKDINRKLDTFNSMMKKAKDLDLQSLDFLTKMSDDDFSTQKALNGAIINDQTMTTNGQLTIKGEKKQEPLSEENLKDDLKAIGSAVFDQQLELVADCGENEDEKLEALEGEIIENEHPLEPSQ